MTTQENEKKEFVVRLLLRLEADTPRDAVKEFVEQTQQFGLYSWTYGVLDMETGDLFHVDRENVKPMSIEEAKAMAKE